MANIFLGDAVEPLGAVPPKGKSSNDPKAAIDGIASQYQVPSNVLLALGEAGRASSVEQLDALAKEVSAQVKAGKGIEDVLRERGGDALLNRAYDIADEISPPNTGPLAPDAPKGGPSGVKDAAAGAGSALAHGIGGAIDYLGRSADRGIEAAFGDAYRAATGETGEIAPLAGFTEIESRGWHRIGQMADDAISPEARQAAQDSMPKGNLADPSTWEAPKDLSMRGLVQVAAQGIGSLAPVVVTALASRGSSLAAGGMGAAMAGGDGRQTAGQIIDDLWAERAADGTPRLAQESDLYRSLVQGGAAPEAAYAEVKKRAQDTAGDLQALIGGAGGAVTGRIVGAGLPAALAGKSVAGNAARGVVASGIEEGLQEAGETAAARTGVNIAAGTNLDVGEGTVESAAAGALAGGPIGALGAVPRGDGQQAPAVLPTEGGAPPPVLALPAPNSGGTIISGGPTSDPTSFERQPGDYRSPDATAQQPAQFRRDTSADGSGGGQAAAPLSPPVPSGVVAAAEQPLAGPLEAISRLGPDLTPQPEAPAPVPLFPDQKPGAKIRLHDPDTDLIHDGVFLREMPGGGAVVRIDGGELELDAQTFDRALNQAARLDAEAAEAAKAAPKDKAALPEPAPVPALPAPALPTPEAGSLSQQALAKVKPVMRKRLSELSVYEARAELEATERKGAGGGWTPGLRNKRDVLRAMIAEAPRVSIDPATGEILQGEVPRDGSEKSAHAPERIRGGDGNVADRDVQSAAGPAAAPLVGDGGNDGSQPPSGEAGGSNVDAAANPGEQTPALNRAAQGDSEPTIVDIRAKASVLRGVPQDSPPNVPGVSMKWDEAESGFIFSRKHAEKVREAVAAAPAAPTTAMGADGRPYRVGPPVELTKPTAPDAYGRPTSHFTTEEWKAATDEERAAYGARVADVQAQAKSVRASKDFKALVASQKFGDAHADSPVAADLVHGWLDAKDGKQPDPIAYSPSVKTRTGIEPYLMAYLAAKTGQPMRTIAGEQAIKEAFAEIRGETGTSAERIEAAAAETDPNPTPAQAEAENYKTGKVQWNGLTLSIENAKGSVRRKVTPDGETAWEVTMPAHYGRILRTEGADGDHVDFYMGDTPDAASVFAIDQVDAESGKFDEHKLMMGFASAADAKSAYHAGFSDGKGPDRLGGIRKMSVQEVQDWLAGGKTKAPLTAEVRRAAKGKAVTKSKPDQETKPAEAGGTAPLQAAVDAAGTVAAPYGAKNQLVSADRAADLRARLKDKLKNQLNSGIDPEILAIGAELAVFHIEAGARRFLDLAKAISDDLGTTPKKIRPYLRSWYNGARDMMEDSGLSIEGMDDADAVRAGLAQIDAPPSPAATESGKVEQTETEGDKDADSTDGSDDGAGAEGGAAASEQPSGRTRGRREGSNPARQRDDVPGRSAGRSEQRADGAGGDLFERAGGIDRAAVTGPVNHTIEVGELEVKGGEKTRARNAVAAIRTMKQIKAEGRVATAEERKALALYGGAGTLAPALPRSDGTIRFDDVARDLKDLLTDEEYRTLSRTSQYAFYTAEPVLRGMWRLAERLGFKGGRVYEPGMGVGGFAGTVPTHLRDATQYAGLELDHVTADIAAALYPKHRIKRGDFVEERLPANFYDMVIGNPPFAGFRVQADPDYPQRFYLHDYFFAKSLDAVRPGGLLMFVTSAGTMNKLEADARQYLSDRADLVGAVRLPNTAFKENGTEVTTDIIVLRKRAAGEPAQDASWVKSEPVEYTDEDGSAVQVPVNRYFIDHPEMILGEQGLFDTLVGSNRIGVRPKPGADLRTDLSEALGRFPEGVMSEATDAVVLGARDAESAETKSGSFYLKDGALWQFDGRTGAEVSLRSRENSKGMPKEAHAIVKELVPIKMALREVYAGDLSGDSAKAATARAALNKAYDAFVAKRGPINLEVRSMRRPSIVEQESARQKAFEDARAAGEDFDAGSFDAGPMLAQGARLSEVAAAREKARQEPGYRDGAFDPEAMPDKVVVKRPNIDPFEDDPESFRLRAVEKYDTMTDTATKTRVFTENAVSMSVKPKISSPEDALLHLLSETGKVDLARIADLSNSSPAQVREELGDKVFLNPASREFETNSKYLSGNVRVKLREAEAAAKEDREFLRNVAALEAVQPQPITASMIRVPVGASWFPHELYGEFAQSLGMRLSVKHQKTLGVWEVDGSTTDAAARNEYGTNDLPFADIMRRLMNGKPMKVQRTTRNPDGTTTTVVDETATQAATDKAKELRDKFHEWFWSDDARARDMEVLYNDLFNAEVAPKYDGRYLTTPGIHADWRWRPHQTAAIARILQSGNTYLAHTVGAGKTSEMIGATMEARRLGIWKKPMIVVPNHMLNQFSTEFYQQYPLANLLIADERRFHTSTRKQFIADAALGDWDAIIITHSAFGMIPVSDQAKADAVTEMLEAIREVFDGLDTGKDRAAGRGGDIGTDRALLGSIESIAGTLGVDTSMMKEKGASTRKKIEAMLEAAEQKVRRQTSDTRKDQVFNFDELGVDALQVDEAHLFRKLSFATGMGNIKGIDPAGSMASMDLYVKTRALAKRNPGRSLVLASGTPITNTMAEAFTISRYLQPEALDMRGLSAFDSWAGTFGQVSSELEQAPDGGYKEVARFAKFINTPELSLMMRQVMDVVTGTDLEQYVTRPKMKGGKRNLLVVEPTGDLKAYQADLGERMRRIENRKGPVQKGDDILLSVINDGRLAAIDMRLVDPLASGNGSKLERMIESVARIWREGGNAPLHGVKREGGYTDEPVMHGPTTQIVFSTLGIDGSKHNPDFKVHRFIKAELIRRGVSADHIILAEDLKTHAQKQRAFGDMNEGKKRILIGSKTLFTGVNAQKRIAAIHNLDPLWYPADDEQRNGRGIRQGNMNPEIEINDYSTKGTYDATMWQMMGRKAGFIEGFFRGDPDLREIEDLGEASAYDQAKAMSTADPRVLELTELKAEYDKLQRRRDAARRQRETLEYAISSAKRQQAEAARDVEAWEGILPGLMDLSGDKFAMTVEGQVHTKRAEAGAALIAVGERLAGGSIVEARGKVVGEVSGFPVQLDISPLDGLPLFRVGLLPKVSPEAGYSSDPVGMARRIEGIAAGVPSRLDDARHWLREAEKKEEQARASMSKLKAFDGFAEMARVRERIETIEGDLLSESKATAQPATDAPPQEGQARESRFADRQPVADLTGNELGAWEDIRQLGRKAEAWYRNNLIGKRVTNSGSGMEVQFRREGSKKVAGRKGDVLLRLVPALEAIIAHGTLTSSEPDTNGSPDIAAWHTISATVTLEGLPRDVVVKVKETSDGAFHYDLSRDMSDGARHYRTSGRDDTAAIGLEDNPVSLNIEISGENFNRKLLPVGALAGLSAKVQSEVAAHGLAGKISARVVRGLLSAGGIPIQGRQRGASIEVNPASPDALGVLRHEIIHALRDDSLWNTPYGLFSQAEWRALVRAARADSAIVKRVQRAYADVSASVQTEEMVAELYREWAADRETSSPVGRIMGKIFAFLDALASALRGEGFIDAALVMERIASGEVGSRGPHSPGPGRRGASEMRAETREKIAAAWNGSRPDMPIFTGQLPPVFRALTGKDNQLVISSNVVRKAGSHGLTLKDVVAAIEGLENPIMVFDSTNETGNLTALVESSAQDGRSLVVAIDAHYRAGKIEVSRIATIHGKNTAAGIIGWMKGGYLRYINKQKAGAWARSIGRQLPKDMETSHRLKTKILQHRDVFKDEGGADREMRDALLQAAAKAKGMLGKDHWRSPGEWLTDAMAGFGDGTFSALALVPGRALFSELGKRMISARAYIRQKEEMDALRNAWHQRSDKVAQEWLTQRRKDARSNDAMMDLMHRATLAGIDPSRPDVFDHALLKGARKEVAQRGDKAAQWAKDQLEVERRHKEAYAALRTMFEALPEPFRAIYGKVLGEYTAIADDFDKAVLENIENATKIGIKRAEREYQKELRRIDDEGLKGSERAEAIEEATEKLNAVKKRGGMNMRARVMSLRKEFESNRLKGAYVPLSRFGDFFVTVRDGEGKVISFSRFESEKDQKRFVREQEEAHPGRVQHGVIGDASALRSQVDPGFVADVERMLAESGAGKDVMDAVWQRWLETLPDTSIRTSKIHRKGRAGWNRDAFRAFGKHMFHGAHQLARLKYGILLEDLMDEAELEARRADNPNRAGLVVREMRKRHAFTMNPSGSAAVAGVSSLAFIWYLGATPAAALANVSQTTVVGIPIMAARFKKSGALGVAQELGRALGDFAKGKGHIEASQNLSDDEKAAMAEAYRRGTVDKTQAHDLASVAETGIEYNAARERVMRVIGAFFHHAERLNREVTFLAAYRMAKAEGLTGGAAIDAAADATWKVHFDYQNTSRPRVMQNDLGKILTTFRQFTVNMLWRLFRDSHQALTGATKEERAEARTQLIGVTLSMMAHAGIRGTWGYGLIMLLLGMFFPGGDDDAEKWLQDSLLVEGDTPGAAAWNWTMGAALNGVPGHVLGLDLKERIGMPNLWFRGTDRELEGEDLYNAYVGEILGPLYGIGAGFFRGATYAADGDFWRATETAVPKVMRDMMKAGRYTVEGVTTRNGDPLLESVNPYQVLVQASGFTPAQIAERYDINTRLKNQEARITDERQALHRAAGEEAQSGEGLSDATIGRIRDFNARYPEYPITPETIRQSMQSRLRASQRNEFGVSLNPKLNDRIRSDQPPSIYN